MITAKQRKKLKEEWLNWHDLRYIKSIELVREIKTKPKLSIKKELKGYYVNCKWNLIIKT